ncbi:MAG: DUF4358 domain-containing protein, partial [Eubacteriales bacterium]|nr:DUF4358 domain-containing protein [Eubacteriales bacterium]
MEEKKNIDLLAEIEESEIGFDDRNNNEDINILDMDQEEYSPKYAKPDADAGEAGPEAERANTSYGAGSEDESTDDLEAESDGDEKSGRFSFKKPDIKLPKAPKMSGMNKPNISEMKKPEGSFVLKVALVIVLIAFLAIVYSKSSAKSVSMSDMNKAFTSKGKITSEMKKQSTRQLMQFIGLDASKYKGFIYYKSPDAMDTTELLVIRTYSRDDLAAVEDQVE